MLAYVGQKWIWVLDGKHERQNGLKGLGVERGQYQVQKEDNTEMNPKEKQMDLTQDGDQQQTLVNKIMALSVPPNAWNFLTS